MIETNTMLAEALTKALETMAFLCKLPLEEDLAAPENTVLAQISFKGPKTGTIRILAGRDFAGVLAQNIGALEQADDETAFDAMKELSNVTCGLLLPMIGSSPADVFSMSIPAVQSGSVEGRRWDEFTAHEDCLLLNIEGFMVAARLTMEE
jgi:CheY-specific phosphatase CheX